MHLTKLSWSELLAALGGAALAISLFLPWYETDPDNENAEIEGIVGTVSAWDAHAIVRFVMLAGAVAPLILAWIVVRDHELSWPRGEATAVIGLTALVLVIYFGVIDRPGEPPAAISLQWGWFVALISTLLIAAGGAGRQLESSRERKPPGEI
jgi:hypothetical protein